MAALPRRLLVVLAAVAMPLRAHANLLPEVVGNLKLPEVEFSVAPPTNVSGMAQASDGRLYFGAQSGLVVFDGSTWTTHTVQITPTLGQRVAMTADGSVFLGLGRGMLRPSDATGKKLEVFQPAWDDLIRFKDGVWKRWDSKNGLPGERVWSLHTGRDGSLWIGTDGGLARLKRDTFESWKVGFPDPLVLAIQEDQAGRVWLGTAAGLVRLQAGVIVPGPVPWPVQALAETRDGKLLVATAHGVFVVENLAVATILTRANGLVSDDARALLVDHRGRIWVGTSVGLSRLETIGAHAATYTTHDGLAGENILSLFEDREAGIWVGARGALTTRITERTIWNLGPPEGLPGEMGRVVLSSRSGSMWVATSEGLTRYENGSLSVLRTGVELPPSEIQTLAETSDGSLWIGTAAHGLVRLGNGSLQRFGRGDGLGSDRIRLVMGDGSRGLWMSYIQGGIAHFPEAVAGDFRTVVNFPLANPQVCHADASSGIILKNGTVWFGSEGGGATRIEAGEARCFTRKDGLPSDTVTSLAVAPDGALWFGTRMDSGLSRLQDGKFRNVGAEFGLWCDSIAAIADDGRGNLWTVCGGGVSRLRWADLTAASLGKLTQLSPIGFGTGDGMRTQEATFGNQPGASVARDGALWTATLLGVSIIASPEIESPRVVPRAVLTQVLIDGKAQPVGDDIVIRKSEPELEIHWSSGSLLKSNRQIFAFGLEGFERRLRHERQTRSVLYRSLAPGRYRFTLRVADGYGGWAPGQAVQTIVVRAPFHRTWPFFFGLGLLTLLSGYGLYRLRFRQLAARAAMVTEERNRLARELHDALGQTFISIGMLLDTLQGRLKDRDGSAAQLASQARKVLDYSSKEIRRIIWDLRDTVVQSDDVSVTLARLVERVRGSVQGGSPELVFTSQGPPFRSGILKHEISPLLGEALANALRYARCTRIDVTALSQGDSFTLTVADNGVGITGDVDQLAAAGHFGIAGMRERARRLGATLDFRSTPGAGTQITLVFRGGAVREMEDGKSNEMSDDRDT